VPEPVLRVADDPLQRLGGLSVRGMKLGLSVVSELLSRLSLAPAAVPRALVAGTNGKGSVAATLSAIFRAAGVRCGLHTSPHLLDVTERVRIDDEDVSAARMSQALAAVFQAADRAPALPVTYFEAVTAAAEWVFREEQCRFAVVEVGLGGRLDATNALDPELAVVASIGLDHVADLGGTAEQIAREKAGIFRRGRPALCGPVGPSVARVLAEEARRKGAEIRFSADSARVGQSRGGGRRQEFALETELGRYELSTPLLGRHQAENVAVAVLAAEILARRAPEISAGAIAAGVGATRWPGRLERFQAGRRAVWLDGCHNAPGAEAIGRFLADRPEGYDLLFGAMADKDVEAIVGPIAARARRVVLACPLVDRAAPTAELRARLARLERPLEEARSVAAGLDGLLAEPDGGDIVVAGSLYVVGEARGELLRRGARS
jgi:dihydrofolate synthase/folylpolyglutamate synthase